jgi:hypothetical protein
VVEATNASRIRRTRGDSGRFRRFDAAARACELAGFLAVEDFVAGDLLAPDFVGEAGFSGALFSGAAGAGAACEGTFSDELAA